jgi:hypothetical protein
MLAQTAPAPARTARSFRPAVRIAAALAAWLGVVVALGSDGWFVTATGRPPLALLAGVVLPIGAAVLAYASSAGVREYVRAGDPVLLTSLQGWRILGGTFLVLLSFGLLPATFALSAGWGDIAVGMTAPFVAWALATRGPTRTGRLFVAWQVLGILDLVVAVGVGASLRAFPGTADAAGEMVRMSELPLSVIPTFAVPLFVILHLASLVQYRARVTEQK